MNPASYEEDLRSLEGLTSELLARIVSLEGTVRELWNRLDEPEEEGKSLTAAVYNLAGVVEYAAKELISVQEEVLQRLGDEDD